MPGPRDPGLTPYIIPFLQFFGDPRYEVCTLITGTQMSKTDAVLDAIGSRLDSRPRPQLYIGPSKDFVSNQFEPRLMKLFDEAPTLEALVARGQRNKKTLKIVAGVTVRLAWAGSETSLSSDQAGDVYIDEFDKMKGGKKGVGDAFTLGKARADTYADRKIVVTSTPKRGLVETILDRKSKLEFWAVANPADIESPIWAKWQSGTRHHWAWRCPHCESWFIPRASLLRYPDDATPAAARRNTWLLCPSNNGCVIEESDKAAMNAAGQFIAPGQSFSSAGLVVGDAPDSTNYSLWVSGLASPFLSWGERIEEILSANAMGDSEAKQGAINKVGELWSPVTGEVLDWQTVANSRVSYPAGKMPADAVYLTFGCDVQKMSLVFVIRAWGARGTSWLVEHGELLGDTSQSPVWDDLAEKLTTPIDGCLIKLAFVDSGFRPGKKTVVPLNRVYEFCRRFKRFVFPTKGSSRPMIKPLIKARPDVTRQADVNKYGLELIRLDPDHWKSYVHERLAWPAEQLGAFNIHDKATEDYCRQLVAEARTISDSGKPVWVQRARDNHYLDAEAMASAAAFMLNVQHIRPGTRRMGKADKVVSPAPDVGTAPAGVVKAKARFADLAARVNR